MMSSNFTWGVGSLAAMVVLAACGDSPAAIPDEAFPVVANADLAVGSQRLLVGLVTTDAVSHAAPDLRVEVDLYRPDEAEPAMSVETTFVWTVPEVRGLYRAQVTFDRAGTWRIALHSGDDPPTQTIPFNVAEQGFTPAIGELAPVVATRTVSDVVDLSEITTDPEPDPRFYQLSLDQALTSGRPTVVVFATPAFCESATCGPMLNTVKQVSSEYPEMNFVHIEIYQNLDAQTRDQLQVVEAVEVWRLPSEPWVFVADQEGLVAAKFEGVVDIEELRTALDALG